MKHLNMTNYQSGLRTLFNSEMMHDSHYKQVSFVVEKQKGENGGEVLTTQWKIAYVTERNTKDFNTDLEAILQSKVDSLIPCANCDQASILVHSNSKDSPHLIYEKQNGRVDLDQLEMANRLDLAEDSEQLLTPQDSPLSSERMVTDLQFSKDGTFVHILRNSDFKDTFEVLTQDYFIGSVRPFLHEMKVQVRFFDDKSDTVKFIGEKDYNVDLKFVRNSEENSADSLMTISGLVVPPRAEVTITLGIKKYLRQFELYPNDPSRGFNIMHMPLLYRVQTKEAS